MVESSQPNKLPQQHEDILKKKTINLSLIGNLFTIIGTCFAVIFGIWSLIITIQVGKSSVKIEKMDSVIQLLSDNDIKQNKEIAALIELQNTSVRILEKNTSQLMATKQQTSYLVSSEQPQIQIENYSIDSINSSQFTETITFKNYGLRPAINLQCKMYYFQIENKKAHLLNIKKIENRTWGFSEKEVLNQNMTTNKTIIISSEEANRNYYEIIDAYFLDPSTKQIINSMFYLKRQKTFYRIEAIRKDGKIDDTKTLFFWDYAYPAEKIILEKGLKKLKVK